MGKCEDRPSFSQITIISPDHLGNWIIKKNVGSWNRLTLTNDTVDKNGTCPDTRYHCWYWCIPTKKHLSIISESDTVPNASHFPTAHQHQRELLVSAYCNYDRHRPVNWVSGWFSCFKSKGGRFWIWPENNHVLGWVKKSY